MFALATAYWYKQWGVYFWPLFALAGLHVFGGVVAQPILLFDDAWMLENAQAAYPNAVDAFLGWEGIVVAMIEALYAVVGAYGVFRLWQARRKSKRAELVADVAAAVKGKETDGD